MEVSEFWISLGSAIGLIFFIEGALYMLFPRGMKQFLMQIVTTPDSFIRKAGVFSVVIGCVIVILCQQFL